MDSRTEVMEARASEVDGTGGPRAGVDLKARIDEPVSWTAGAAAPNTPPLPGMIGASRAMEQVYRLVRMVANRDTAVLVTGETGTGKELVAGAIHELSRRSKNAFVVVNCAAIPEALLEAELFGYARGGIHGSGAIAPGKSSRGAGRDVVFG
jgi:transcriptional regulator with GAF, ATPase, and Fis domain